MHVGYMTEINIFFTVKYGGNFSFEFCTFSFLFDLITNKARKLEVEESNLIMENIPRSLSLSLCVCVYWLGFRWRLRVIRPTLVGYVTIFLRLQIYEALAAIFW